MTAAFGKATFEFKLAETSFASSGYSRAACTCESFSKARQALDQLDRSDDSSAPTYRSYSDSEGSLASSSKQTGRSVSRSHA